MQPLLFCLCGGIGGSEEGVAGDGFNFGGCGSGREGALRADGAVMLGGENIFIRPVKQGVFLAFTANGIEMVGVLPGKEKEKRDAGQEGEDDNGS